MSRISFDSSRSSTARTAGSPGDPSLVAKRNGLIKRFFGPSGSLCQFLTLKPIQENTEEKAVLPKFEINVIDPYPATLHFEIRGITFKSGGLDGGEFKTDLVFKRANNKVGAFFISCKDPSLTNLNQDAFNHIFSASKLEEKPATISEFEFLAFWAPEDGGKTVDVKSEPILVADLKKVLRTLLNDRFYLVDDEAEIIEQAFYEYSLEVCGNSGCALSLAESDVVHIRRMVYFFSINELFGLLKEGNVLRDYIAGIIGVFKKCAVDEGWDKARVARKLQSVLGIGIKKS